ncbi:MAG: LmeA family phospholipid-binding protein [Actinomycetes bacterium]
MRTFLVFVVVLALAGVAGDRVAAKVAADEAEQRLAARGLDDPRVEAHGFPFLTQLMSRRFGEVTVRSPAIRVGGRHAEDVTVRAADVTGPRDGRVTVGRLAATGTVTYQEVLRQAGNGGMRLRPAVDGKVALHRDVTVLGRTLSVTALGRVEARGRSVRVVPTSFKLTDGSTVDQALAAQLVGRFSIDYPVPDLPRGVTVRRVTPASDGFVVEVAGADVSFAT